MEKDDLCFSSFYQLDACHFIFNSSLPISSRSPALHCMNKSMTVLNFCHGEGIVNCFILNIVSTVALLALLSFTKWSFWFSRKLHEFLPRLTSTRMMTASCN